LQKNLWREWEEKRGKMLNSCRVRITGRKDCKNYQVRKPVYKKKVATKEQNVARQEKLSEVTVKYNPYDKLFSSVGYLCPICGKKIWLGYSDGRRNMVCATYGEEYILDIKRTYN